MMSEQERKNIAPGAVGTVAGMAAAALAAFNPDGLPTMSMVYALLPVLTDCLARGRHDRRLAEWLADVNARLRHLGDHLNRYSDAQYRLTVGIIQTAFETIDAEKLRLLKAATINIAGSDYLEHFEAQLFSRILRDVSATEIAFLVKHRDAPAFSFLALSADDQKRARNFHPNSSEALILRGIINLGLVARSPTEGTYGDLGAYLIAPFVPKLLELVAGDGSSAGIDAGNRL